MASYAQLACLVAAAACAWLASSGPLAAAGAGPLDAAHAEPERDRGEGVCSHTEAGAGHCAEAPGRLAARGKLQSSNDTDLHNIVFRVSC